MSIRWLPLLLIAVLTGLVLAPSASATPPEHFSFPDEGSEPHFAQCDGFEFEGPTMDGSALYRRYRELQTAAGVRSLRFHDLRHTFGTQAIASGAHVMDVKEWMGHRHLSTTMRYVHHQPRHEAAARLGRHFTGAASELDALLGEPGDLEIGPPDSPVGRDSGRPESTP